MGKYQIGVILGAWVNFTPPIRGGAFRQNAHSDMKSTLIEPITTSTEIEATSGPPGRSCRPPNGTKTATIAPQLSVDNTEAVEQAFDIDVKDYPSVDRKTQQEIVKKYRELHNKVKREGYYDCRYQEYGKELSRYLTIFAFFLVCLRTGWYITSAAFLGLFWVRHYDPADDIMLILCSTKSCSLPTMRDIEV